MDPTNWSCLKKQEAEEGLTEPIFSDPQESTEMNSESIVVPTQQRIFVQKVWRNSVKGEKEI